MSHTNRLSNCPVCGCPLDNPTEIKLCTACETPHHHDCWEYNEGCAIYGCTASAPAQTLLIETGKLHSITESEISCNDITANDISGNQITDSDIDDNDIAANEIFRRSMTVSPDRFVFNLMSETSLLINIINGIRVLAPALILINGLV